MKTFLSPTTCMILTFTPPPRPDQICVAFVARTLQDKMKAENLSAAAVLAFKNSYAALVKEFSLQNYVFVLVVCQAPKPVFVYAVSALAVLRRTLRLGALGPGKGRRASCVVVKLERGGGGREANTNTHLLAHTIGNLSTGPLPIVDPRKGLVVAMPRSYRFSNPSSSSM